MGKEEGLVIEKPCAVTAYDMKLRVERDGRVRGLWFHLLDDDEFRRKTFQKWVEDAADVWFKRCGKEPSLSERMSFESFLRNDVGHLLKKSVDEAMLLEWPALKELHAAIGREIKNAPKDEEPRPKKSSKCPHDEYHPAYEAQDYGRVKCCKACGEPKFLEDGER